MLITEQLAFLASAPTSYAGLSQAFQRATDAAGEAPAKLLERYHLWLSVRDLGQTYHNVRDVERYCEGALQAVFSQLVTDHGLSWSDRRVLERRADQLRYALGETALLRGDMPSAEARWQQLKDRELLQWSQWLRTQHLRDSGADPGLIVAAYRSLRPAEGTLLWLERHWAVFQVQAAQSNVSQACDALDPLLATAPEYRGAAEEAHKFFTAHRLLHRAFRHARQECIRTGSADWAERAVSLLEEGHFDRPGTLTEYRPLLTAVLGAGLYAHWARLLEAIHPLLASVPFELQSLIGHVTMELGQMEGTATPPDGMAGLPDLLRELRRTCHLNLPADFCRAREPDLLWHQMRIAEAYRQPALAYEAAVWLQVLGDRQGGVSRPRMRRASAVTMSAAPTADGHLAAYPWAAEGVHMLELLKRFGYTSDANSEVAAGLSAREFRLFVCGTFTNGKSSLLNLLMGEALLKTTALPTTATLVFLRYGERSCARWSPEVGDGWTSLSWEELPGLSTFTHGEVAAAGRHLVEVRLPVPLLEEMALVDTPGFGDLGDQAELIFTHLGLADKLLVVLDGSGPLRKSEADVIRRLAESVPASRMAFVLNKMDLVDEDERDDVEEHVHRTLQSLLGAQPALMPFSVREAKRSPAARASLSAFVEGLRPGALDRFRFDRLAQLIWGQVAAWRELLQKEHHGRAAEIALLEETEQRLKDERAEVEQLWSDALQLLRQQAKAIQSQISVKAQAGVPDFLAPYAHYVGRYTNYKTLRDQLETVVSPALAEWARRTLHTVLERLVSEWMAEQEHAYRGLLREAELRAAARQAALQRHPALSDRLKLPVRFRRWDPVRLELDQATRLFLVQRSYRVQVLDEAGFFSGLFRGVSSFFSGDASVLGDVRNDVRQQLTSGAQSVAERIESTTFAGYSELEASWKESLLGEWKRLQGVFTDDVRAASSAMVAAKAELAAHATRRAAILEELDRLETRVEFWAKQVQVGIVYANGELYRAV